MAQANQLETYASQYFTGTQASIWVGDIWIDEVFGIQFSASQSVLPIYGYASAFFDAVAKGKVLVYGAFEINFIDEGYLYAILMESLHRRLTSENKAKFAEQQLEIAKIKGIISDEAKLTKINPRATRDIQLVIKEQLQLLREVSETKPDSKSRREVLGSVLNQIAQLDLIGLNEIASSLNGGNFPTPSKNVIYEMVPFTLKGYFGNPEIYGSEQGTYKEIRDCFLVGNEMIIGSGDEVVKERYSFLARMHV